MSCTQKQWDELKKSEAEGIKEFLAAKKDKKKKRKSTYTPKAKVYEDDY